MLKFMKPHSKGVTPERLQKQKELFSFSESCFHGFPAKPSAFAWDAELELLAIGTSNGAIRIYGAPGVEFYGVPDSTESAISHLCFLQGQAAVVALNDDNSLHLWKIQKSESKEIFTKVKSASLEGKLKKISVIIPDADCQNLFVGTEGGNIYLLDLASFTVSNDIIYQDVVMQNVPEDYKVNPGPVESIAPHPTEIHKILVGYQRGLIVLWDRKQPCAEQTYVSSQQLECLSWNSSGTEFMSSHNDGSYMTWSSSESSTPKEGPTTVYGPFPCKPISKITWLDEDSGNYLVFSGGMPRANYGDRNTVTVIQDEKHVSFSLSSKVVDYLLAKNKQSGDMNLFILAEEEVVFVDLSSEEWLPYHNQYLSSLHSSAITCSQFLADVDSKLFEQIKEAGDKQNKNVSKKPWPVNGGRPKPITCTSKDLLLTGHEDGTVRFWDTSDLCLQLLYKLNTSVMFLSDDFGGEPPADEEEDWPPFKKVGVFDPYSDDPRLGIKKLEMCPQTGHLIIAGTAGQVIVTEMASEQKEFVPQCVDINLVADADGFVWKSHSKLELQKEPIAFPQGMQPSVLVQLYPPASCTSLHLHSEWGLVAVGTAHGFSLFDYFGKKNLLAKSTLSPTDLANAADEGPMSRRKSMKKSLRESFRRLRKGRSQRKANKSRENAAPTKSPEEESVKPVERAIEARSQHADYIGSMVRCLHLTKCYIASTQMMSATLWAGTNAGTVYVYTIFIPPSEKRMEVPLTVQLGKEIQLKHAAPVINIMILDGANKPFPEPMAVKKGVVPSPDNNGPHKVLISSEEQFKVFTLPQLKPYCKYKLTAHEGSRVRKIGSSTFSSVADKEYRESCFMIVTNLGDISVFSLPSARRQVHAQCIKKEDINGINSVVFTKKGEVLYLVSSSELARISLSASHITCPRGTVFPLTAGSKMNNLLVKNTDASNLASASSLCSLKKNDESKESADLSLLSADITIDSIRDHMKGSVHSPSVEELQLTEKLSVSPSVSVAVATSASETVTRTESTVKEESHTTTSVTIVKTSTIVPTEGLTNSSVQVIETAQSPEGNANNGEGAPSLELVHDQEKSH